MLVVDFDQGWTVEWQQGVFDRNADAVAWMRSRPDSIKALMIRFPPSCLVRATRPLGCPHPGTAGIVVSYIEDGAVTVIQQPGASMRAECDAGWLEVVGYWRGLTPAVVREILQGTV
jgi:hypothetical protein